ncbi:hypothetical protein [Kineobactrum salinum]|uniref:PEP-CTERM sorting domain-containing protein n=1 Tax=Kineobactrum salinum TaxID=2708301 RepID=A0A6C0U6E7_9GAMM|nr:hypothetical protein [Kineobactrum salinum]QIB66507.1 hypothetical protein G3T16_14995 [Kineobactrum salinum]
MKMHKIAAVAVLLWFMVAQTARAGLILPNGQEWELRGRLGGWLEQSNQAALDVGWTWAVEAEWLATGLDGQLLTDPAWSALMGDLDGQDLQAAGWFADPLVLNGQIGRIVISNSGDSTSTTSGTLCCSLGLNAEALSYRVSYRAAQIAEPATILLSALGLLTLGWFRRLVPR